MKRLGRTGTYMNAAHQKLQSLQGQINSLASVIASLQQQVEILQQANQGQRERSLPEAN
jgi:prefoldin subunit 5